MTVSSKGGPAPPLLEMVRYSARTYTASPFTLSTTEA